MSRTRIILVTLAGLTAFGVQAADFAAPSREQVRAEYFQARSEGSLSPTGEVGYIPQMTAAKSSLSRAAVLRELAAEGPAQVAEGTDLGRILPSFSVRSRADVHAEAHVFVQSGERTGGKV